MIFISSIRGLWLSLRILIFSALLILCALMLNRMAQSYGGTEAVAVKRQEMPVIIIDPGHGGEDGGAVGVNGCIEKDINLEISLILNDLLNMSGIETIMTRTEDIMLYDEALPGKKKAQDLKKRLSIAHETDNSITVSIHMNTYPSPKYSGAQVYYSPNNPESAVMADAVQKYLSTYLQPDNKRQTKAATSAIYLLHNIKTPAILIECGFISNPAEAELLCTDSYRHKVACSIYASLLEYLHKEV